jgi:DNA polymerase I-like protein with 3'-5' exonuclease and polymerase domains
MTQLSPVKTSQFKMRPDSENECWLVLDLESDGLYDSVTVIHCIVIHDIYANQTYKYGPTDITAALEHLANADVLIGQNILFYDIPVLQKLFPDTAKFRGRIIDTLICTQLIWPKEVLYDLDTEQYPEVPKNLKGRAGLKAWGYRLSNYKIEFKDFSEYSEEMLAYCEQDVRVTLQLFQLIQKQNYAEPALKLEHDFALAINKQVRAGFPFDVDACLDLVDDLRAKKDELHAKVMEVFPPIKHEAVFVPKVNNKSRGYVKGEPFNKVTYHQFNPGSRPQIVSRLKNKYGWVPEELTDKGNPILDDEVLSALDYPEAKVLGEYLTISKRLGQIADGQKAWLKYVNNQDSCMHGEVVTNGCITGRCAHRNPNMGQVPASYSPYGKECRSLFHAPDGWDLLGVDAKALELRCLGGYLALWDDGEYANLVTDESVDIHVYNQDKFGVPTRDIAKRLIYAMLYGCGNEKAGGIVDPTEKDPMRLKQLGRNAINGFMDGVPALKQLKQKLAGAIQERGYLRGLDGRALFCRSDFSALNVLLQGAGAMIMKQVIINTHNNLEAKGLVHGQDWIQHAMIHDEIQLSCPKKHTALVKEQALLAFPQAQQFFAFRCDIDGDAKVGWSWDQTH